MHLGQPIGAFLAAILVLIPLPWHWRARNIGTVSIIGWLFVLNLIYAINSIVWAGNVNNAVPVWCDITTKIMIGGNVALPIATMCVCKHLELASSNRIVRFDAADRRRRMLFDTLMCFGVPFIFMALHYVVQGHRFDIIENYGCQPTIYFSIPAVFIVYFPALLFSVIAMVYAGFALYHFICRRASFATHLQNSNSSLTTNRYLRLMAMALSEMVWSSSLTTFDLYNNTLPGLRPWTSWADVHSNFSRVDLYATMELPASFLMAQNLFWWSIPASAYLFFLFFGLGEEARKEHSKLVSLFRRHILRRPSPESLDTPSLPSAKGFRPFKISSLVQSRLSDEKDFRSRSISPQPSSLNKGGPSAADLAEKDVPPIPAYSIDLEAGHLSRLENFAETDNSFTQPRLFTSSLPGSVLPSIGRPSSPPRTFPSHERAASAHATVLVTVQTVRHAPTTANDFTRVLS